MSCDNLHVGPENPLNMLCFSDAARRRPYPLITQNSPLIAHHSLLKNLSYLRHRRAVVHICQKRRKRDFGPSEENSKITNPLIVKQIQNHEKPFENTQKKDLSVS